MVERLLMNGPHYAGFYDIMQVISDKFHCDILKQDFNGLPENISSEISDMDIHSIDRCVLRLSSIFNQSDLISANLYLFKSKLENGNLSMNIIIDDQEEDSLRVFKSLCSHFGGDRFTGNNYFSMNALGVKAYSAWAKMDIYLDVKTIGSEKRIVSVEATAFSIEDGTIYSSFHYVVRLPENYITEVAYVMDLMKERPDILQMITSKNGHEHIVEKPNDIISIFNSWFLSIKANITDCTIWTNDVNSARLILDDDVVNIISYEPFVKMAAVKSGVVTTDSFKAMVNGSSGRDNKSIVSIISKAWDNLMR